MLCLCITGDHKGELEKATGYKFEASGIGNVVSSFFMLKSLAQNCYTV
jgi:hypothetical protein